MTAQPLPNIVMVVLDTHRRDRVSTYGYHRQTTPNLDHFAAQATVFENAIAAAQWTIPSHASMFTGEYPTTHQTIHPHSMLNHRFDTIARLLCDYGYHTTGFCNNPLLGVLNNGLKRGFETFYNYCGAFPSVPEWTNPLPWPLSQVWKWYTQQLRKLSYPIQNAFAHSDILFQLSLNPRVVPFWSKLANFKGNTATSIRDTKYFLESVQNDKQPHFVFLNLMETHLPYAPPDTFINKFAPYFAESYEARTFMRRYNAETFRWLKPLPDPLPDLHHTMLNDMYDAEANYQDHLLAGLLEYLNGLENTMVVIVADHGEGIGEHDFMGHSFVAYQELVHVPLIIKFAEGHAAGERITETVSTRRLFHTVLHAAQIPFLDETATRPAVEVKPFSLTQTIKGRDPEQGVVFTEAYPPANLLNMMKKRNPELVAQFHCDISRRAVYQRQHKLARIDGVQDELFALDMDPGERASIIDQHPELAAKLAGKLKSFLTQAMARQIRHTDQNFDLDDNINRQLRALGYLD